MAKKTSNASSATTVTAIAIMLATTACPAQAFQPSSAFRAVPFQQPYYRNHDVARISSVPVSTSSAVTMRSSPWDPTPYGGGGIYAIGGGGFGSWPTPGAVFRGGPVVSGPPGAKFQESPASMTQLGEPVVTSDTANEYKLKFALPPDIEDDGLDVSVSGRLLTLKVKMTREEDAEAGGRNHAFGGGWVSRSTRTDTMSRQFVLPDGVSTSGVSATWKEDGTVEVRFNKLGGDGSRNPAARTISKGDATAPVAPKAPKASTPTVGNAPTTASSAASVSRDAVKEASNKPTKESTSAPGNAKIEDTLSEIGDAAANAASTASAAAEYLAGLSSFIEANNNAAQKAKGATATSTPATSATAAPSPSSQPCASPPNSAARNNAKTAPESTGADSGISAGGAGESWSTASNGRSTPQQSVLKALDQEFGEFAKLMWGEENAASALNAVQAFNAANTLRFPTEEEMAARVEAAREERARRVTAMRRASMAAHVSERDGSYVVKMDLPEGATRKNVSLTITPDNAIRVSFAPESRRSPFAKDVRLPRDAQLNQISAKFVDSDEIPRFSGNGGGVVGLEVTVRKAVAPEPKRINIM